MTPCLAIDNPLSAALCSAAAELANDHPDDRRVITLLSEHAATVQNVVLPAAARHLPAAVAELIVLRRLEHTLFRVHQQLSGDGRGVPVPLGVLREQLRSDLDDHLRAYEALLVALQAEMTPEAWDALVERHAQAMRAAPTRPHPHAPHSGIAQRIAFAVDGAIDRLLDSLESRQPVQP